MSAVLELNPDNSVTLQITLTNGITGAFVNDATVTGEIKDSEGAEILATTSMPFVAGSDGIYRVTVTPISGLILGDIYTVIFDATGTDSLIGHWCVDIKATKASIS